MRRLIISLAIMLGMLVPALPAGAVNVFEQTCDGAAANTKVCDDVRNQRGQGTNPAIRAIRSALTIISFIAGIAAVISLLLSGFRFIAANGDSNGVSSAKRTLAYTLVGIIVIVIAQSIVVFVLDRL